MTNFLGQCYKPGNLGLLADSAMGILPHSFQQKMTRQGKWLPSANPSALAWDSPFKADAPRDARESIVHLTWASFLGSQSALQHPGSRSFTLGPRCPHCLPGFPAIPCGDHGHQASARAGMKERPACPANRPHAMQPCAPCAPRLVGPRPEAEAHGYAVVATSVGRACPVRTSPRCSSRRSRAPRPRQPQRSPPGPE